MTVSSLNSKISTLNFILFIVGFDLFTSFISIFVSNISEVSQTFTIPYRAISLIISSIVIFLNFKKKVKITWGSFFLIVFLGLLTIRVFYDFLLREDIFIMEEYKIQISLLYSLMIISTTSFFVSFKKINLSQAFFWIFLSFAVIVIVNFFTVEGFALNEAANEQLTAGVRNTIDTGYIATNFIILSIYYLKENHFSLKSKILIIPVVILSFIILLKSGSRGPLLSLFFAVFCFLILRNKLGVKTILFLGFLISLLVFLLNDIWDLISDISPVMAYRVQYLLEEGDNSRIKLFLEGINGFLNEPFFGSQAFIYNTSEKYNYPHQLIIEAFMATGFIGGISLGVVFYRLIKDVLFNISHFVSHYWFDLLMIPLIIRGLTAGSIYGSVYPAMFAFFLLARNRHYLNGRNDFRKPN